MQYRPTSLNILPPVVKNLFIINGLFLLATYVLGKQGINLEDKLGMHFIFSEKFQPYQLVTYMFMHADRAHLISNMITLWIFGSFVENYWGPRRFLTYYLLTGMGAACIHYFVEYYHSIRPVLQFINSYPGYKDPAEFISFFRTLPGIGFSEHMQTITASYDSLLVAGHSTPQMGQLAHEIVQQYKIDFCNTPVIIGASGSVFGILLAFGMLFPDSTPFLLLPIKGKWIVLMYGLTELAASIANAPGDNVAHFAHLGGMFFGFILIKYWRHRRNNLY
ncbi:MAG: rhomboid family intramembrane serine protease [Bacteroidia bacterium]